MTTATTTAAAAPQPTKKRSAKKAAKKTAPPGYISSTDVKAELAELATNIGTASPPTAAEYARLLYLDFANTAAGNRRPDGVTEATQRVSAYFRTDMNINSRHHKERVAFLKTQRYFSELQNCRCFVQEQHNGVMLLLKTVMAAKGNLNAVLFDAVNNSVYEAVHYIKAYNMVIDIMAELTATPEMRAANLFTSVDRVVTLATYCNKEIGANKIELDELTDAPPPEIKTQLRRNIESGYGTLLSWLMTAQIDMTTEPEK